MIRLLLVVFMIALLACDVAAKVGGSYQPTTSIVPDDFPTIQAAFDAIPNYSSGRDTIFVRNGFYAERVYIRRGAALLSLPSQDGYSPESVPRMLSLSIDPNVYPTSVFVRGMHIMGGVTHPSEAGHGAKTISFESCRIDSGLSIINKPLVVVIRGCTILGDVEVHSVGAVRIALNTVVGGGMKIFDSGYGDVRSNVVLGPSAIGIEYSGDGVDALEGNLVTGTTDGIQFNGNSAPLTLRDNVVMDCSGTAFRGNRYIYRGSGRLSAYGNKAMRCGGYGFDMDQSFLESFIGNTADSCGLDGLWATPGLYGSGQTPRVDHNVIGHCGGAGIRMTSEHPVLTNNTVYLNRGSGIVLSHADSIVANVSFGNSGFGLEMSPGVRTPVLACNDWFGNGLGTVSGVTPGASDLAVDPLFCDATHSDVQLHADSPLADASECGLIGALGVGCPDVSTPTLVTRFDAIEVEGAIEVRWQFSSQASASNVTVERASDRLGPWTRLSAKAVDTAGIMVMRDIVGSGPRFYRLVVRMPGGHTETVGPISASFGTLPMRLELEVSGTNPTRDRVELRLGIPGAGRVHVGVYDVQGRELATIADRMFTPGWHALTWEPGGAPSGVCFVRARIGRETRISRVVLAR